MNTRPPLALLLTLAIASTTWQALGAPGPAAGSDPAAEARERERQRRRQEEADAANRRAIEQFYTAAQETGKQLGTLHEEAGKFQQRVKELLTNDDGRRIAMSRGAFVDYLRIQDDPAVSLEDVKSRKAAVDSIADGLKKELAQAAAGHTPSPTSQQEVADAKYWSAAKLAKLNEQKTTLDALLAAVPPGTATAAKTLEEVIRDEKRLDLERWRQAQDQGRNHATTQATQIMVDAAQLAELQKAEVRAQILLRETREQLERQRLAFEELLKERDAAAQARAAQADQEYKDRLAAIEQKAREADAERHRREVASKVEHEKAIAAADKPLLIQRCKDPQVQARLAPFITPGYNQPGERRAGIEKMPVSLSKLRQIGALNPNREGIDRLMLWTAQNADPVRPKWPHANWDALTAEQRERVKLTQQYLIELGETLVELKMLSP